MLYYELFKYPLRYNIIIEGLVSAMQVANIQIPVKIKVDGKSSFSSKLYQTSALDSDDLAPKGSISNNDLFNVPPRSILTVVIE